MYVCTYMCIHIYVYRGIDRQGGIIERAICFHNTGACNHQPLGSRGRTPNARASSARPAIRRGGGVRGEGCAGVEGVDVLVAHRVQEILSLARQQPNFRHPIPRHLSPRRVIQAAPPGSINPGMPAGRLGRKHAAEVERELVGAVRRVNHLCGDLRRDSGKSVALV